METESAERFSRRSKAAKYDLDNAEGLVDFSDFWRKKERVTNG